MKEGSDCVTGKEQFTKSGARDRVRWWRQCGGDRTMKPYRCSYCGCFHVGHSRRVDSKRARGANR